jgi:hypothetical protein
LNVTADEGGVPAPRADDLVQAGDGDIRVDAVGDEIGEGLSGELVDDVQDLDHPAGGGDIELVVERPHVIGLFGPQPLTRRGRCAEPLALASLGWDPQAFFTPQTLDLLAVHHPALSSQHGVRPPVAPPRVALGQAPDPLA